MKQIALLIILFFTFLSVQGQSLYIKTFGDKNNPAVIFLHGGPRGNSVQFEATTARKLAENFYVIVYDRRGEGRSADENAKLTYQEAFDDLNDIYKTYKIKKANLIGFSFGGLPTIQFAEKYDEKVNSIVLVSALVSQQETYNHIFDSVKKTYTEKGDTAKLRKVAIIENLDKNSAEYRGECFALASENGYFKVNDPSEEAAKIYEEYKNSALYKMDIRNNKAPEIFYKNEKRSNIDLYPVLIKLRKKNVPIYALYGKLDGIFSSAQMNKMKAITGSKNFGLLDNCSHYLYADQQQTFLNSIENWLK
ncbi:alpha/beta fold hydrolase [Dyadobacter sp. NIV53]|uniref:alpha/beta fold hydrolase n=1 Tax=Dyadobacter sp. NIV53 TaxID=2861765 RepID=UPI001C880677|nr:alpha/beta hydrolase [Dyadobacter sp. NIV53]